MSTVLGARVVLSGAELKKKARVVLSTNPALLQHFRYQSFTTAILPTEGVFASALRKISNCFVSLRTPMLRKDPTHHLCGLYASLLGHPRQRVLDGMPDLAWLQLLCFTRLHDIER